MIREFVATDDLAVGMFVAELDRPWIETPFLLQGFLIEDEDTLDRLRRVCRFAYVDRTRSVGEHQGVSGAEQTIPAAHGGLRFGLDVVGTEDPPVQRPLPGFMDIIHQIRGGELSRLGNHCHRVSLGGAGQPVRPTSVERELISAAPVFADTQVLLGRIIDNVRSSLAPDVVAVQRAVDEMMRSASRNPDALLWLTRLRRTDRGAYDQALDSSVHLMIFGRFLGLGDQVCSLLGMVGLMQDIGKLRVPERILNKRGSISPRERLILRSHVDFSMRILEECHDIPAEVVEVAARHHERYDGSGYPAALAGDEIGLLGELAGLVDSYCAMTHPRPYGPAMSSREALDVLSRMRGQGFRESLVDDFIQCVGIYPVGTLVELNTGEVALVIGQNRLRRLKPRVVVLLAPDKTPNAYPNTLDLLYEPATATGDAYVILRSLAPGAYGVDPEAFHVM